MVKSDGGCVLPSGNSTLTSCEYVRNNSDGCGGGGYVLYAEFVFCHPHLLSCCIAACLVLLLQLFVALSVAADSFFCPCLAVIVDQLKISQNIAGVTFLAFGNGAPDIFSSIASVLSSNTPKPGLAFGALMGAGVFLSTVIVALVTFVQPFDVMRRPLLRDLFFFIGAVAWTLYIMLEHVIYSWEAIGFICLYVVYAIVVVLGRFIRMKLKNYRSPTPEILVNEEDEDDIGDNESAEPPSVSVIRRMDSVIEEGEWRYDVFRHGAQGDRATNVGAAEITDRQYGNASVAGYVSLYWGDFIRAVKPFSGDTWKEAKWPHRIFLLIKSPMVIILSLSIPVVNLDADGQNWSKSLTLLHCFLCPLVALVATKYEQYRIGGIFPMWMALMLVALVLAIMVFLTTKQDAPPKFHKNLAYVGFVMAVFWIYALAREVVGIVTMLGALMNASQDILGLTLLAWSNSLGDLISDLTVARQGYPRMAVSACIGGPLFNLLLGIGISFTIATVRLGHGIAVPFNGVRKVLITSLGWSLLSSLILLPISRFRATRIYAAYLLAIYASFLIVVILTEKRIIIFPGGD